MLSIKLITVITLIQAALQKQVAHAVYWALFSNDVTCIVWELVLVVYVVSWMTFINIMSVKISSYSAVKDATI